MQSMQFSALSPACTDFTEEGEAIPCGDPPSGAMFETDTNSPMATSGSAVRSDDMIEQPTRPHGFPSLRDAIPSFDDNQDEAGSWGDEGILPPVVEQDEVHSGRSLFAPVGSWLSSVGLRNVVRPSKPRAGPKAMLMKLMRRRRRSSTTSSSHHHLLASLGNSDGTHISAPSTPPRSTLSSVAGDSPPKSSPRSARKFYKSVSRGSDTSVLKSWDSVSQQIRSQASKRRKVFSRKKALQTLGPEAISAFSSANSSDDMKAR
ncbi:hypothetical protein IEO21_06029 [Rhodonia placenta]|uniref:Uncharacterized protein n=1 Tax=Rhodonia placenta TaxID=104341 RepID=A0A8H7P0S9_9APHY|nr:hypothetical protein IEO21_06029 [Postia placenta]